MENIPKDCVDPFYRYKRRRILIEKQKNCTLITNIDQVAKDLRRSPGHLAKFFSFHLFGSRVSFVNEIKNGRENMVIKYKGNEGQDFEALLEDFIAKFVLCEVCANPETDFNITKKTLELHCRACGGKTVPTQDNPFCKFIVQEYIGQSKKSKENKNKDNSN